MCIELNWIELMWCDDQPAAHSNPRGQSSDPSHHSAMILPGNVLSGNKPALQWSALTKVWKWAYFYQQITSTSMPLRIPGRQICSKKLKQWIWQYSRYKCYSTGRQRHISETEWETPAVYHVTAGKWKCVRQGGKSDLTWEHESGQKHYFEILGVIFNQGADSNSFLKFIKCVS